MPFKAIDSLTDRPVIATWYEESLILRGKHPKLHCPCCNTQMFACGGKSQRTRTHFRHQHKKDCLISRKYPGGDRNLTNHTIAVFQVYSYLAEFLKSPGLRDFEYTLDFEHYSSRIPDRIADIAVLDKNGEIVQAHEVQLTKIPVSELEDRTESYYQAGVEVTWWLGIGCHSEDIQIWSLDKFGYRIDAHFDFTINTSDLIPGEMNDE